jgi:hypothetical protein
MPRIKERTLKEFQISDYFRFRTSDLGSGDYWDYWGFSLPSGLIAPIGGAFFRW